MREGAGQNSGAFRISAPPTVRPACAGVSRGSVIGMKRLSLDVGAEFVAATRSCISMRTRKIFRQHGGSPPPGS
jgi:hypothetical protein